MKKNSAIFALVLTLTVLLCGCKSNVVTPTVSPNVPVVSESPAIPSPSMKASPTVSPVISPTVTN